MAPYKDVGFHAYGRPILIAYCVLFLNAFGAALLLQRKFLFLLKGTGRKLSHLDRQFQIGQIELPVSNERFPGAQQKRRNGFWNRRKCFRMKVTPAVGV